MNDIKIHHVIVLLSLLLTLIGTLLILEKINVAAEPIPTATVVMEVEESEESIVKEQQVEVRIMPLEDD